MNLIPSCFRPATLRHGLALAFCASGLLIQTVHANFDFSPRGRVSSSILARSIAVGDINGDGVNDIVYTRAGDGSDRVSIRLGDGRGNFGQDFGISGGGEKGQVKLADLNHNGKLDLLVTGVNDGTLRVRLGNGDGTFGSEASFVAAPSNTPNFQHLELADIYGNGRLDAICGSGSHGIRILPGDGNGGFHPAAVLVDQAGGVNSLVIADVNGNGQPDILWTPKTGPDIQALVNLRSSPTILNRTFGTGLGPNKQLAAVNDSDGSLVWALSAWANNVSNDEILWGRNPFASNALFSRIFINRADKPVIADFNGDGRLDLALSHQEGSGLESGRLRFQPGQAGDNPFAHSPTTFNAGTNTQSLYAAQVDADGNLDVLVGTAGGSSGFQLFTNNRPSLVVSTTADENGGNSRWNSGTGASLREVLQYAQTLPGPKTITFAPFLTANGGEAIFDLTSNLSVGQGQQVTIRHPQNGPGSIRISGFREHRVFDVGSNGRLTLENLDIRDGKTSSNNPGAGIHLNSHAHLTVLGSTFTGHDSGNGDGAVIFGNDSNTVTIRNSTLTNNTGAGVIRLSNGTALFEHNTIAHNNARVGLAGLVLNGGSATLRNNILSNPGGSDLSQLFLTLSGSHNLIRNGDTGGLSHTVNADPLLGALGNHGGPTRTMPIAAASPAFNAGTVIAGLTTDQRGQSRNQFGAPDFGAFEADTIGSVPNLVVTAANDEFDNPYSPTSGTGLSLREAIEFARASSGATAITFDPSVFNTRRTITLSGGALLIADAGGVSITAPAAGLVVDANNASRVIENSGSSTATLTGLTLRGGSDSSPESFGGGIANFGTLTVENCLLTANSAITGSAIQNTGLLTVRNSTFSGNGHSGVSVLHTQADSTTTLHHVTFGGNDASGTVTNRGACAVANSVFADGQFRNFGSLTGSNNFIPAFFGPVDLPGTRTGDPGLSALGEFGGRTQTMRPISGSQLINTGAPIAGITSDQRGIARPQGAQVDLGAVELQVELISIGLTNVPITTNSGEGAIHLASRTSPNPSGGTFSGPGVSGGQLQPANLAVGSHTINYNVNDPDNLPMVTTFGVQVQNTAPTGLTSDAPASIPPGQTFTLSGGFASTDAFDTHTVRVNWGDGSPDTEEALAVGQRTYSLTHTYPLAVPSGSKTISITILDPHGATVSMSRTISVTEGAATWVSSSNVDSVYGGSVTFTATVTTSSGTPTGTVSFLVNGTTYASNVALTGSGNSATATYSADWLPATSGTPHTIQANYHADLGFTSSSGTLTGGQTVNRRPLGITNLSVIPKPFDGNAQATLDLATAQLTGVVSADVSHVSLNTDTYTATYDTPAPGANKPVTVTNLTLSGSAAANYSITPPTNLAGSISEAPGLVVTITGDTVDAFDNQTSLREALAHAHSLGGPQTITFAPALTGQTVSLSAASGDANGSETTSALRITNNITLEGPATAPGITLAVDATVQRRHFLVDGAGSLTLSRLTLTGGNVQLDGSSYGGAVWSFGSLTVRDCTFTGNTAAAEGGAIHAWSSSPLLHMENSTFAGNSAGGNGSAIGTAATTNTWRHLTITGNTGASGPLWIFQTPVTMVNSIAAGNAPDGAVTFGSGAFTAQSSHNLLGSGTTGGLTHGVNGNLTGVPAANLGLSALHENGGPSRTIALLPGSPAIDAGCGSPGLATDQRGVARPQLLAPDIGAFEYVAGGLKAQFFNNPTLSGFPAHIRRDATVDFTWDGNTAPAPGVPPTGFSTRWTGFILISTAGDYTFHAASDDGLRLWIGDVTGAPAVDQWVDRPETETSTGIYQFAAGQLVPVKLEMYQNAGGAAARLRWEGPGIEKAIIPANQLLPPVEAPGLKAEFFNNTTLAGLPAAVRFDPTLDFSWNGLTGPAPAVSATNFSTRWSGFIDIPTTGTYTFHIASDDGVRLWIGDLAGAPVINEWVNRPETENTTGTFNFAAGRRVPIRIEYFQGGGEAAMKLRWSGPGIAKSMIPTGALYPPVEQAATPLITPAPGAHQAPLTVNLSTTTPGAMIRYTTDGSTPTPATGLLYTGAFNVGNSATVKALAFHEDLSASPVASTDFSVLSPLSFWRNLHDLAANGSQDLANPSGDGVENQLKYAFNMAPNAGDLLAPKLAILPENGSAGLPSITRDAQGRLVIKFVRRQATTSPGITYIVETGEDPSALHPLDLSSALVDYIDTTWERVTVTDPVITAKRFGRVRVQTTP